MWVGEFAARLGVRASTVRYWEVEGLMLPPPRRAANGYRVYRSHDLARARRVGALRAVGVAPAAIREIVQACEGVLTPCRHTDGRLQHYTNELTARIGDLERVRRELLTLRHHSPTAGEQRVGMSGNTSGRLE
jgi:DNA-binding transcriptional MerR regulator